MKSKTGKIELTKEEYVYFMFLSDIRFKYKLAEDDLLVKVNQLFDEYICEYKLDDTFFEEVIDFYDKSIKIIYPELDLVHRSNNLIFEKDYYDYHLGSIMYHFYDKKGLDYFETSPWLTVGSIDSEANDGTITHIYRKDLNPALLLHNIQWNRKIVLEETTDYSKVNRIFVGINNSKEKISTKDYEFLTRYDFAKFASIDIDTFNLALGLERLSEDGVMIFNNYASILYKNDLISTMIRKYLIDNKLIKGILLTKSFSGLSDYEATLILSKSNNDKIVLVDAKSNKFRAFYQTEGFYSESNEFHDYEAGILALIVNEYKENYGISIVINVNDIISNDYKLGFNDYFKINEKVQHRSLEDIQRDIIRTYEEMERNVYYYSKHYINH